MATKDTTTKAFMSDAVAFADMFNVFVYHGKQKISADSLVAIDPTEIADLMAFFNGKIEMDPLQKHRDVLKQMCIMTDNKKTYVLLGIENQSHVDRTMVVRVMLYDAIRYLQQFKDIASANRRNKKPGVDHLNGVAPDDKIAPIVTLVINLASKKWDEPTTLHELLETNDDMQELLEFVPNFKMNLYDPHAYEEDDFSAFQTQLNQIFKYIKFSKDKKELKRILAEDPVYAHLDVASAKVIDAVTGSNLRNIPKEGTFNMCKAIEDMIMDAQAEGKAEGKAEGAQLANAKNLSCLMANTNVSLEEAARMLGINDNEVQTYEAIIAELKSKGEI